MMAGTTSRLSTPGGLRLRAWEIRDADALLDAFAGDDMAAQAGTAIDGPGAASAWIARAQDGWASGRAYSWTITDVGGDVVGSVAVTAVDLRHQTGWFSYWTHRRARGRGVAAAGARAVAEWAFTDLGLHRLELGHRVNNPASCRVASRAGFLVEGLERAKLRYGDERFDVELHARLVTDPPPGCLTVPGSTLHR